MYQYVVILLSRTARLYLYDDIMERNKRCLLAYLNAGLQDVRGASKAQLSWCSLEKRQKKVCVTQNISNISQRTPVVMNLSQETRSTVPIALELMFAFGPLGSQARLDVIEQLRWEVGGNLKCLLEV